MCIRDSSGPEVAGSRRLALPTGPVTTSLASGAVVVSLDGSLVMGRLLYPGWVVGSPGMLRPRVSSTCSAFDEWRCNGVTQTWLGCNAFVAWAGRLMRARA